jgi:hypothetical protein
MTVGGGVVGIGPVSIPAASCHANTLSTATLVTTDTPAIV